MDEAVGRVQFVRQRNFLNLIISKLDKHVVLLLINYIASQPIQQKIFEVSPSRKPVGSKKMTTSSINLCPERKKPTVIGPSSKHNIAC